MTIERNADGLKQAYGNSQGQSLEGRIGSPLSRGGDLELILDLDWRDAPLAAAADTNIDLMCTSGLPGNALITEAYFDVTEGFTSGGATTLDAGLIQEDGTVVDGNGILAAIAKTAIDAEGERAAGNGALINGSKLSTISGNSKLNYLSINIDTADLTAGKGRLVVKYRLV